MPSGAGIAAHSSRGRRTPPILRPVARKPGNPDRSALNVVKPAARRVGYPRMSVRRSAVVRDNDRLWTLTPKNGAARARR